MPTCAAMTATAEASLSAFSNWRIASSWYMHIYIKRYEYIYTHIYVYMLTCAAMAG